jgi:hypothetical protein
MCQLISIRAVAMQTLSVLFCFGVWSVMGLQNSAGYDFDFKRLDFELVLCRLGSFEGSFWGYSSLVLEIIILFYFIFVYRGILCL